jgi:hypothetical protein
MKRTFILLIAVFIASTPVLFAQNPDGPTERARAEIRPLQWEGEITIDGNADEGFWSHLERMELVHDVTSAWMPEDSYPIDPDIKAAGDYHVTWRMTFDDEYFYIFAEFIDDAFVPRSTVSVDNVWENDCLELFFLFAPEDVYMPDWALTDASQVRVFADTNNDTADIVTAGGWAGDMIASEGMMGYTARTVETANGYNLEARIPLMLIIPTNEQGEFGYFDDDDNFVPVIVSEIENFQFDIQAADRDDPTPRGEGDPDRRKYLHQWSATWNRNWGFTQGYGILTVGRPVITSAVTSPLKPTFRFYPNPATDRLVLENLAVNSRISVINLLGQEVYGTLANSSRVDMDINFLKNGIYMIRVTDEQGKMAVEKFMKN